MELIKVNPDKHRSVYRLDSGIIRKYWHLESSEWITSHVTLLNKIVPGYIIDSGKDNLGVWIDVTPLSGIAANNIIHTDEFIIKIYNSCLKNITETAPYVHGDWVLSNMFVDGDNVKFCDWDNVGIYPKEEVMNKLFKDLESAFGKRFKELINDSTIV